MKNFDKKIQKFIAKNSELIERFSEYAGMPFENYIDDVECYYYNIKKQVQHIPFNSVISDAITYTIDNKVTLWDGFSAVKYFANDKLKSKDSIQRYFNDVGEIYKRYNNDYDIEYIPENRDKLIEMNLKTVISIAKKYQGLGLPLEDLISAGNLGLVISYDKFDPKRSMLKSNILKSIEEDEREEMTGNDFMTLITPHLTYGDVRSRVYNKFNNDMMYTKKDIIRWVNRNVFAAKFNSVSSLWIRAYILIELDNNSRLIKKPKAEINKDRLISGSHKKEILLDIDAPIGGDGNATFGDFLQLEDDSRSDMDTGESYDLFKKELSKLMEGVKSRDKSIFFKKFGIGLPRPMTPREIAQQENLSIARISQIFQSVINQMQMNQVKYNINQSYLFELVKGI